MKTINLDKTYISYRLEITVYVFDQPFLLYSLKTVKEFKMNMFVCFDKS